MRKAKIEYAADYNDVAVYRIVPSDDEWYSISAEINGNVEMTQYDKNRNKLHIECFQYRCFSVG